MTMPKLTGDKVPEFLRKRGIRWIDPEGVRRNFEVEQAKKERVFAAGFSAGQRGGTLSDALAAYRNSSLESHCRGLGFTADELRSLNK
jgi:hypothetical protein